MWAETVVDDYAWLRNAEDPEVLAHLAAENAATDAALAPTEALQQELFEEIKARVKETDLSVPVVKDDWSYYVRTEEGQQYGIHCRRRVDPEGGEGSEVVMVDENVEAGDEDYFEIGVFEVSPDHRLLAWAVDYSGDERFRLVFRDLDTGVDLDDVIEGVTYGSAWAMDNKTLFYVRPDDANRPHQVWRHELGTVVDDDVLVYQEDDERFFCGVGRDKDDSFIYIGVSSSITDEIRLIPADDPTSVPLVVEPRIDGIEYGVAHHEGQFLVITNAEATNFRVMTTPVDEPSRQNWVELVPHRDDVMLTGFDMLGDHLVLFERTGGITRVSTRRWSDGSIAVLDQPEPVYTVWSGANPEPDTSIFRFGYSSMVSPAAVYTVDLESGERILLKETEVLGGFDKNLYETERAWATSHDGEQIPISMVWRKDRPREPGPCLLYAYGAYESSVDPTFSSARLSLLDRGFVFAIAHVRGGGEMGRDWYTNGKTTKKTNTFHDAVACARHLIDEGWTEPTKLALRGASAGGLLVGAVLNQAPELFGAAVAQVPFVDVINTMLDVSLPLTVTEWEEWGNPAATEDEYRTMCGYAPYENVAELAYPSVLATGGLTDPRVGFWEPAKWVLRLRERTTSQRPILLWTELGAGHGGPTGRYAAWHEEAKILAFVLAALDC
jgi:oligopeptidase B